jgi:hypothetical protein
VLLYLLVLFVLIQAVPYGRDHDNPPVTKEPDWKGPRTAAIARRACYDCHSNETEWPWYSHIAPFSWLVQNDVDEGREHLNFSEFDRPQRHAVDAAHEVEEGEMPLWYYRPLHPGARLDEEEKRELIRGLEATFGKD